MDYMSSAIPVASDFDATEFSDFCSLIQHPVIRHRKVWEWSFIFHHLQKEGKLAGGMKGLGFGVGLERLPSAFASRGCMIVATDSPPDIGAPWQGQQHSGHKSQLFFKGIVDEEIFDSRVSFRVCDMNGIDPGLTGFDFCWSACAFEHLGSLDAGARFVANSLKSLKIGGIAVHTTEFNLSSNSDTSFVGGTVIYRRKDIDELHRMLVEAGHMARPIPIVIGSADLDSHVDVPPYTHNPHLKLRLMNFVTTSIGIVIERGR
jgi:hypothetical protein